MSEPFPGLELPRAAPARPSDAAVVVLFRRVEGGVEVFWLKRSRDLAFAPGFFAFPGGRVDEADARVPVNGVEGFDAALRTAAARELFEETGVLLAEGAASLSREERSALRRELLQSGAGFGELLARGGLSLRASDFHPAGRWITPPFLPRRFDARVFLAELPNDEQAEYWPGEHSEGGWVRPKDALARWERGEVLLHPPNLFAMQTMASFTSIAGAASRMSRPPSSPGFVATLIEFQRGIRIFPLETPTLPPATHTNAYVLGNGELVVVDPGAEEGPELTRLLELLEALRGEGKRSKAVLLTHHHSDHVGGARALSERLAVPVWCHALTAERLPFPAGRLLADEEVLELAGEPPMRFRVLHTPGHARGHLCLVEENSRAAIAGDMVAGVGTIVIDPPEGDMAEYVAQLRRLRALPVGTLYPAHGPVMPDGPSKLDEYLSHRAMREEAVLSALAPGGSLVKEVLPSAYADVPEIIHPLAERSALAILLKLVREGRVRVEGERYFRG